VRSAAARALELLPKDIADSLPAGLRGRSGLCGLRFALENIHFPQSEEALHAARRRLVYEELLVLRLALARLKDGRAKFPGLVLPSADLSDFRAALPFELTGGQESAIAESLADMASGNLMHRLIQGDVGSGKTLVAAACALSAIRAGAQAALMTPTEILAEQHYASLSPLFEKLGARTALLTGRLPASRKAALYKDLEAGRVDLVIGTHALLSVGVRFQRLGLTIADEQHRFGVRQQQTFGAANESGQPPHRLVMSATPIPRTLGLVLYGDMDVTVMRGMPPGRRPVRTYAVTEEYRARVRAFIAKLAGQGLQTFIVCPLIEDAEGAEIAAAESYAEDLRAALPALKIELLHGKLPGKKKDAAMRSFAAGESHVLVATTVVEVGVNVPNAALMLIENAERFGLSQLHQLRGRVGRGSAESYCVLFLQGSGQTAKSRMEVMLKNHDGFAIAEADLALRGPGDFFGSRQHGLPAFKLADLSSDMELLEQTKQDAELLLSSDPGLLFAEHARLCKATEKLTSSLL
jgi:ATP-dependent DNA helicase RecG